MSDVFLSYTREDLTRIQPLIAALGASGLTVWWDRTILPGKRFDAVIEEAIDGAACVIVVWSRHSVGSEWVKLEASEGMRRRALVPVLVDDVAIPFEFRRVQAADLIQWTGGTTEPEFRMLLDAVRGVSASHAATREGPPPVPSWTPPPPPPLPVHVTKKRAPIAGWPVVLALVVAVVATGVLLRLRETASPVAPGLRVVGVMEIKSQGHIEPWMCNLTRDKLNATLSKFSNLQVYSREKIDFLMEKRGLSELEAATSLGIQKMVSGTLSGMGSHLALQVHVVDTGTGVLEQGGETTGSENELEDMQNRVALEVIKGLHVEIAAGELERILALRGNATPQDYKLLADTMGGFDGETAAPPKPSKDSPRSGLFDIHVSEAWAAGDDQQAIRDVLERYRLAVEGRNLETLASLHVALTDRMREALVRYFDNAQDIHVRFTGIDVVVERDQALATFTRTDEFTDAHTGRPVRMELRVSSVIERVGNEWKVQGLKSSA